MHPSASRPPRRGVFLRKDLHATLFTAMGVSPKTAFDIEGRPFYATEDGKGKAVKGIFV